MAYFVPFLFLLDTGRIAGHKCCGNLTPETISSEMYDSLSYNALSVDLLSFPT